MKGSAGAIVSINEKLSILSDLFGNYFKSGHEYLFRCPNPNCKEDKQKLSINLEKNVFKCWICDLKGNNIKRLIRRYGNFLQKQKWNQITGEVELSTSFSLFAEQEKEIEETIRLPPEFLSLTSKKLPYSAIEAQKYLFNRGITKQDILKWKMGYAREGDYKNRIIVPSFNLDGKVNYFIARTYTHDWQTYKNPNISKNIVWNELYINWKNDVVLVEGVFDAIRAENAIPLLGSSLREGSKLFQEILKHDTPIYLALDPDAEKKAFRLIKSLLLYDIEIYKVDISGYKDVGEMDFNIFQERKKKATLVNAETYLDAFLQWMI